MQRSRPCTPTKLPLITRLKGGLQHQFTILESGGPASKVTGNSGVYVIVGVIIGVIIVLSLLFIIMICCFMKKKGKSNKKNEYSDLTGNGTLDKNIPMVPNSLSTNDEDRKPAKLEAEASHETVEVHYMMPNIGSNVGSNPNSKQCGSFDKPPSLTKEKADTENQQPMEYAVVDKSKKKKKNDDKQEKEKGDTKNQQPMEYAVVDKSKKTKKKNNKQEKEKEDTVNQQPMEYAVVDKSKKKKKKDDKQKKVDDPQNGADDVHHDDNQTSDGTNQSNRDPTLHYAALETLPKPTELNYIAKDDPITQYALVV